ncbi:MAG TPA: nitroreductase [Phycisphaerales bacterium]|nr:nitroreductase [Phycisphaerales bacterium]
MDLIETMLTRRSPALTGLGGPGPTGEQLRTILTIGARVPDHGKLAPWRFVVIEGDARHKLGQVIGQAWADGPGLACDGAAKAEGVAHWSARLLGAPCAVVVVSSPRPSAKVPRWEQELSAGAVCMNLLLGAKGLGFGAVWLTEWYAYDTAVLAALGVARGAGLEEAERVAGFIHIGTELHGRADRERPNLDAIVSRL